MPAIFALAAVLGVPASGALELTLRLDPSRIDGALLTAVIEELTKISLVLFILSRRRSRGRRDALVFGLLAGLGFALFETLGFALALIGDPPTLAIALGLRSLGGPLAHALWTAAICVAVVRAWSDGHRVDRTAVGVAAGAISLHALWDLQPVEGPLLLAWYALILVASALLLRSVVRPRLEERLRGALRAA